MTNEQAIQVLDAIAARQLMSRADHSRAVLAVQQLQQAVVELRDLRRASDAQPGAQTPAQPVDDPGH